MKKLTGLGIAGLGFLASATLVFAALTYSLFGDASIVSGGNPGNAAQLRSDATVAPNHGGVDIDTPEGLTYADLDTLSTDFNVTDDDCGGGSPRFQINVDTSGDGVSDGNVHVALGPSPTFTNCPTGWQGSGNLIGNEDAGRYDYSQFGGSGFTTYSNAPAAVMAGTVVGMQVVVDASWSNDATNGDGEQTVLVDNVVVNNDRITFEPTLTKDSCKNNGWRSMNGQNGMPGPFKNQGDCVSFFSTGGKNPPDGQ